MCEKCIQIKIQVARDLANMATEYDIAHQVLQMMSDNGNRREQFDYAATEPKADEGDIETSKRLMRELVKRDPDALFVALQYLAALASLAKAAFGVLELVISEQYDNLPEGALYPATATQVALDVDRRMARYAELDAQGVPAALAKILVEIERSPISKVEVVNAPPPGMGPSSPGPLVH